MLRDGLRQIAGRLIHTLPKRPGLRVGAYSPGSDDNTLQLWDASGGHLLTTMVLFDSGDAAVLNGESRRILILLPAFGIPGGSRVCVTSSARLWIRTATRYRCR